MLSVVDRAYGLHPSPETFTSSNNANVIQRERKKFVQQTVAALLSKPAPYLCGANENSVSSGKLLRKHFADPFFKRSVPFGHPAIAEVVGSLAFCPKTSKHPLASIDLKAFEPVPLPLIAYACTGVSLAICFLPCLTSTQLRYALDEYKTGVRVKKKFTEIHYAKRYRKNLRLLKAMEASRSQGHLLADIRDAIFDRGR